MAVCCQNLPLGALSSHNAPSMLVGELFKKFGLFVNTGVYLSNVICSEVTKNWSIAISEISDSSRLVSALFHNIAT
jgi:hypothetical protein